MTEPEPKALPPMYKYILGRVQQITPQSEKGRRILLEHDWSETIEGALPAYRSHKPDTDK